MVQRIAVEFTIEPFTDGAPGRHVTEAVAAVEEMGETVEIGPFGSSCVVDVDRVGAVVTALMTAAYANGATHVSVHAERVE